MPGMLDNQPQTTTQKTTQNPYAPAQGNLQDILTKAKTIANNGTFTPTFSANTTGGIQQLGQLGQTPSAAAAAAAPIVAGTGAGYTTGATTLGNIASGQDGQNPYIDSVLKNADQLTADSVNQQFSAAGRYGSGAQTTALADKIGNLNINALTGQYNTDKANQINAANTLTSQGIQAAPLGTQIDSGNANQAALQIQAGQLQDQNDAAARLAPATAASFEAGLTQPIANSGGTTTANGTQVQQSNPLTTGLGLGIAGLSLLSDERAKENIRDVGKTHDGQKIYSYNYKGDPRPTLGLLAQEVEKDHPEAVGRAGGMKTVNYRTATKHAARGKVKSPSALGALAG